MAKRAGFDGVEVHGANGYIIDQFLRDGTNRRTDAYGGTMQNRMRLLNEILDAVCKVWPARRVGVRLTPENTFNSMSDSDAQAHFGYFVEQLSARVLAHVHVLEGDMMTKASALARWIIAPCARNLPAPISPTTAMTSRGRYGCPVGTLCTELAKLSHASQGEAKKVFMLFRSWLRRQFTLLGGEADADELATHLLARSQGGCHAR